MITDLWLIFVGLSCGIVIVETLNRVLYKKQQKVIDMQELVIKKYEALMLKILDETEKHTKGKDRELN